MGLKTYFFIIGFNIILRSQFTLSEIVYFLACSGRMFCLTNACYICSPLLSPIFNHPKIVQKLSVKDNVCVCIYMYTIHIYTHTHTYTYTHTDFIFIYLYIYAQPHKMDNVS